MNVTKKTVHKRVQRRKHNKQNILLAALILFGI